MFKFKLATYAVLAAMTILAIAPVAVLAAQAALSPYEASPVVWPEFVNDLQAVHPGVVEYGKQQAESAIDAELGQFGSDMRVRPAIEKAIFKAGMEDAIFRISQGLDQYNEDAWKSLEWMHKYYGALGGS